MRLIKKAKVVVLAPAAYLASGAAMAQEAVDTTGLVSTIESAMGPVGAVGLAVLGVLAGIMVFTLIRRVMR
ncbi:hypothetical protein IEI94_12105 [Halomonas sp. ML-15]|uniref:major capsid protein n=1 Tax=Halomonas sp. ML-15 TaxID=2773305 RepID=UPI001746BA8E|nr:major capsid protein [Halomonas sp. ML-15]MBD3896594.1 hypothetical protein [Halomonas sp. ML-15]